MATCVQIGQTCFSLLAEAVGDDVEQPVEEVHQLLVLLAALQELLRVQRPVVIHVNRREDFVWGESLAKLTSMQ